MKDEILKALEEQYKIYGNSSGTTTWDIHQRTGISQSEIKELLDELIKDRKVKKQEGLNSTLYYLVK